MSKLPTITAGVPLTYRVRNWLIRLLAGDHTIILNTRMRWDEKHATQHIDVSDGALLVNNRFEAVSVYFTAPHGIVRNSTFGGPHGDVHPDWMHTGTVDREADPAGRRCNDPDCPCQG